MAVNLLFANAKLEEHSDTSVGYCRTRPAVSSKYPNQLDILLGQDVEDIELLLRGRTGEPLIILHLEGHLGPYQLRFLSKM